jgi:lipoprotein Spr
MLVIRNKYQLIFVCIFLSTFFFISCRSTKDTSNTQKNNTETKNTFSKSIEKKYALALGVSENEISNRALYSFIDEWYGVPYKYGGKNKSGIDCSNFASTLYRAVYNKQLNGNSPTIFNQCKTLSKKELTEGDLLFFKIESDQISHIGVYLQNNKFIHATTKKGIMIDDLDEDYYQKYFYKAGRIK